MTAADSDLDVRVEQGLPQTLPAGSANALFVFGTCFHKRRRVAGLEVVVDGVPTAATAFGMPRIDLYQELNPPTPWVDSGSGSADDPLRHSYRSGFWATVPVRVPDSGEVEVAVRAELDDGSSAELQLEPIAAVPPAAPAAAVPSASLAICMATWEPEPELIRAQIESIREQTEPGLGLPDQRRLLGSGGVRGDRTPRSPAIRASSSPARRAGSASTGTSSGRCGWCRPGSS